MPTPLTTHMNRILCAFIGISTYLSLPVQWLSSTPSSRWCSRHTAALHYWCRRWQRSSFAESSRSVSTALRNRASLLGHRSGEFPPLQSWLFSASSEGGREGCNPQLGYRLSGSAVQWAHCSPENDSLADCVGHRHRTLCQSPTERGNLGLLIERETKNEDSIFEICLLRTVRALL